LPGCLKPGTLLLSGAGLHSNVSGTLAMRQMAKGPFNILDLHTLTGQLAIWLMLAHATWATYVIYHGSDHFRHSFHRYSLFVWMVWLIPYFWGDVSCDDSLNDERQTKYEIRGTKNEKNLHITHYTKDLHFQWPTENS